MSRFLVTLVVINDHEFKPIFLHNSFHNNDIDFLKTKSSNLITALQKIQIVIIERIKGIMGHCLDQCVVEFYVKFFQILELYWDLIGK